jgi:ParB family chromosome partitioning protein
MSLDPDSPLDASPPEERPADEHAPEAIAAADPPSDEPEAHPLRKHHVAPALIALDRVDDDDSFQVRPVGDVAALATDVARLGQVYPVELRLKPPDRFQVISGFRRVAALRFLQREKVLARLHTDLSDEDALLMALASAIHAEPVSMSALAVLQQRLEEQGRLTPPVKDMLAKALDRIPLSPEHVDEEGDDEEEVDADELAQDIAVRLGEINQDLSLIADVYESLEPERKEELLKQLRYSSDLVAFLEGR